MLRDLSGARETIFALASGAGRSAIAVLRISGPASRDLIAHLCRAVPMPRRASVRRLRDAGGAELDRAIVLWLPGPDSYTGEDSAELHLHGGTAVLEGVAAALVALGARPAEAGEFTRRAFLNGRLDLLEAEAVADLVAAESSAQREQALRQLRGELGLLYNGWAERLRRLMAHQEALIDFPDEELPPDVEASLATGIADLAAEIGTHLADGRRGERVREGLNLVVVGPPNVGKSSIINALAGRDVAIVSEQPGTTRDALEARVVLAGVPATLVDTAGLRDAADPVEAEGVRRARARAERADLSLAVEARDAPRVHVAGRVLRIMNKIDLGGTVPDDAIGVSALTGAGMARLRARLEEQAAELTASAGPPPLTRHRHRAALAEAETCLRAALHAPLPELRAEDLRLALRAFGRVTGVVGVEEILDTLFSSFCIGK
ncbi:MAG: tRNA uridine-5-carboxymethylaminomethyl(34) synthesis GTPase MnmE [Acetobacteraceae bacterium]|nr:tRNA uridine-5-carboxymethylaminomethyl(34) synthesis GTPase MnmE [Acetobacteraceae bacterium]